MLREDFDVTREKHFMKNSDFSLDTARFRLFVHVPCNYARINHE